MILTITPNPSIDYLFEADRLQWDDANRVEMPRVRAGGQGINLTRAARALGGESVALAFFGGDSGSQLKALLAAEGTEFIDVPIAADTRVFFGVRETSTGRSMLVNARGPVLAATDRTRLVSRVRQAFEGFARLTRMDYPGEVADWRAVRAQPAPGLAANAAGRRRSIARPRCLKIAA